MPTPEETRAYSVLEIRSLNDGERVIEGVATTPSTDRMGDIIDPMGAKFDIPMPLLWQHNHDEPVGHVTLAKAQKSGITFRAKIAKIDEEGDLKRLVDKAWQAVKANLVRGVSIGFKPTEFNFMDDGGVHFKEWEWLELSLVTIPANVDATITVVKKFDQAASGHETITIDNSLVSPTTIVAASGPVASKSPGASGRVCINPKPKEKSPMAKQTIAEQRSAFEATRQAKAARMAELMEAAGEEGETLAADDQEEYDGLVAEIKKIDAHLSRLDDLDKAMIKSAKPVNGTSPDDASASRGGAVRVDVRQTLPKGTGFTRYVMAMAAARGVASEALEFAKRWDSQTPEVSHYIREKHFGIVKAEPGTVYSPGGSPSTWGGAFLAYPANLAAEFVELLYPLTLLGRMNGWRMMPFNVRVGVQTGGSTVNWVGEAAAKPVTELEFTEALLTYSKIAGIVVLTEELVRLSTPSAEAAVRTDLTRSIAKFIDEQMLDASVTASASRPASLTQGVSAISASGYDADALYIDINAALAAYDDADTGVSNVHIVTTPALARGIATIRNPLGQFEFTGVQPSGGSLMGFPVLVSNSVPDGYIVFIKTDEVWLADDGGVTIDASREATLDMAGGNTPTFNLFQKNCVAIRAERWIRWQKRRDIAVQLITGAAYNPAGTSPA